jgi:L-ascorbate metabolism protein UlaG (beta-lactamase superfamily)
MRSARDADASRVGLQKTDEDGRWRSPHFDGQRFRNPIGPAGRSFWQYLKWVATSRRRRWPRALSNPMAAQIPARAPAEALAATFINHASFLLQVGGLNLLTDPVYSDRVGPANLAGPKRSRPPGVPFEALPEVHVVLLSHNHYDHLDVATLRRLQERYRPLIVTPLGNGRFLRRHGCSRVIELDWWESHVLPGQVELLLTPAQHFSSRHFFDRDRTLWGGFVIASGHRRIYFVGDSGYGEHFREIGRRVPDIDLALVPIGAYEPRWFMRLAHINPDEAVRVHLDVRARLSLGMHFGTFQLTDEAIDDPPRALREALPRHGVSTDRFLVPEFGQTVVV